MGYLRCKVRNAGAIVSGLTLTLSMEWHCAQYHANECQAALRRRRLRERGLACT